MSEKTKTADDVNKLFSNGHRVLRMTKFEHRPTFTLLDLETGTTETWAVGSIQDQCFKRLVVEGET